MLLKGEKCEDKRLLQQVNREQTESDREWLWSDIKRWKEGQENQRGTVLFTLRPGGFILGLRGSLTGSETCEQNLLIWGGKYLYFPLVSHPKHQLYSFMFLHWRSGGALYEKRSQMFTITITLHLFATRGSYVVRCLFKTQYRWRRFPTRAVNSTNHCTYGVFLQGRLPRESM